MSLFKYEPKGCRTLDAKMANDNIPKKYQISRLFFFEGGGGGSMENVKYVS